MWLLLIKSYKYAVFSMKIMRNSKSSNHRYVIFAHQSVKQQKISYQHKSILTAILPTHSNTSNVKIGKLSLFSTLRFVKWHFLSFVFKFFVPNLFLSLNSSNKPYCISVCYIKSVVYQEANEQMGLHTYATRHLIASCYSACYMFC